MVNWFIIWMLWNILSLWLAFSVIKAILSWHQNRLDTHNKLLQLLRSPASYLIVCITGYLLFESETSSLEYLVLGALIPLLTAYFLIIADKLISSIQLGKNEEILRSRHDEPDVISSFKKQQAWRTSLLMSLNQKNQTKKQG